MTPLQQEIRKQWVEALRSGKYKRGSGKLKFVLGDGTTMHCCLGVLCELAVEAGVTTYSSVSISFDAQRSYLPESVRNWAGLQTNDGLPFGEDKSSLAARNDRGESFESLAQIIESDDRLFV